MGLFTHLGHVPDSRVGFRSARYECTSATYTQSQSYSTQGGLTGSCRQTYTHLEPLRHVQPVVDPQRHHVLQLGRARLLDVPGGARRIARALQLEELRAPVGKREEDGAHHGRLLLRHALRAVGDFVVRGGVARQVDGVGTGPGVVVVDGRHHARVLGRVLHLPALRKEGTFGHFWRRGGDRKRIATARATPQTQGSTRVYKGLQGSTRVVDFPPRSANTNT
eukprot:1180311-Prorocentrum_minimum.AAC.4